MKKIGIDARLLGQQGPGRYIINLLRELEKIDNENQYIIFVTKEGSDLYHPQNQNFRKWVTDYKWYTLQEQFSFLLDLLRARLDLLHVPHFNVPIFYPKKFVLTIHDLIMSKQNGGSSSLSGITFLIKSLGYGMVLRVGLMRAKKIIVPSKYVKQDIIQSHNLDPAKIRVAYEGVDQSLLKYKINDDKVIATKLAEMGVNEKYFLYVGSAYPHKNLKSLIVAFKDLVEEEGFDGQLVIAGKVDKFSQRIAGFVRALKLDNKVVFVARFFEDNKITDEGLAYLYMGAMAYVFPSLEEGFSITPLEAQAFGVPVLISDIPAHKEVFGSSAMYLNPKSTVDIAGKMKLFAEDKKLREALIELGRENVKRYSWAKMASEILREYKDVL